MANQQSHRNATRVHLSPCLPLARSAAPYAHGQQDDYFRECLRHVSRTQSGSSCDPAAPDKTRNQTDPRSTARHSPVVPQRCETRTTLSARPKASRFPVTLTTPRFISATSAQRTPELRTMPCFPDDVVGRRAKIDAGLHAGRTLILSGYEEILIDTPNPLIKL